MFTVSVLVVFLGVVLFFWGSTTTKIANGLIGLVLIFAGVVMLSWISEGSKQEISATTYTICGQVKADAGTFVVVKSSHGDFACLHYPQSYLVPSGDKIDSEEVRCRIIKGPLAVIRANEK